MKISNRSSERGEHPVSEWLYLPEPLRTLKVSLPGIVEAIRKRSEVSASNLKNGNKGKKVVILLLT